MNLWWKNGADAKHFALYFIYLELSFVEVPMKKIEVHMFWDNRGQELEAKGSEFERPRMKKSCKNKIGVLGVVKTLKFLRYLENFNGLFFTTPRTQILFLQLFWSEAV